MAAHYAIGLLGFIGGMLQLIFHGLTHSKRAERRPRRRRR